MLVLVSTVVGFAFLRQFSRFESQTGSAAYVLGRTKFLTTLVLGARGIVISGREEQLVRLPRQRPQDIRDGTGLPPCGARPFDFNWAPG